MYAVSTSTAIAADRTGQPSNLLPIDYPETTRGNRPQVATERRLTAVRSKEVSTMSLFGLVRLPFALPRRKRPETVHSLPLAAPVSGPVSISYSSRPRRSLSLLRALNADCPSCHGIGCVDCAGTGME
jgi:hypothetical protein